MTMENIQEMLEEARLGDADHSQAIITHIKSFPHVILRGAGKFGSSFGAFLVDRGIPLDNLCYWDIRADELGQIHGIPVLQPFAELSRAETTLVINCIPNGSISGSIGQQEFADAGFKHYLSGMALFEALMCRIKPETGFKANVCIETTFCNWCACKRLPSMLYKHCKGEGSAPPNDKLVFTVATFALNQKCTLQCTHCGQYINHYHADERINFPFERIKTDIDRIFAAVDAIGYVSLIGGEPFLHPALNEIVGLVLSKPNFGVLGITTNGICEISDQHLQAMNNGRTRIIFSDYTVALDDKQKKLFAKNVKKVADAGISHTVGQPLWSTPASLLKQSFSQEKMQAMKSGCNSTETCKTIQNGIYYPCSTTAGVGSHHVENYLSDWVVIDDSNSAAKLREQILAVDNRRHYQSCGHCGDGGHLLKIPGEQGIGKRYIHIGKR